ncbi:histidine phosphatase superfamily [Pseudoneurospora amorphoporcata]|uniref:Histidine phosphatase superfamily n=1 Tax=Pseudoneurospora amorphoporcata TaxID=241081 RepID=A0AAN6SBJ5_9PEZI|nr:histidine phosphatase superfamily [Pseudoneurospora amorphoporcata]
MPPTLILVRHAEALHNLGQTQCRSLREHFFKTEVPDKYQISLIIVSPMRRTIETALLSFGNYAKENNIPIVAHAGWQENSDKPCDTGSTIEDLNKEFPEVDFSRVDEVWPDKSRKSEKAKKYWYTKDSILQRGEDVLKETEAKVWPEMEDGKAVIAVSHSGFLRAGVTGWWFNNGDYRIFEIEEREVKEGRPSLKQITGAKGGMGESFETPPGIGRDLPEAAVGGLSVGSLP